LLLAFYHCTRRTKVNIRFLNATKNINSVPCRLSYTLEYNPNEPTPPVRYEREQNITTYYFFRALAIGVKHDSLDRFQIFGASFLTYQALKIAVIFIKLCQFVHLVDIKEVFIRYYNLKHKKQIVISSKLIMLV